MGAGLEATFGLIEGSLSEDTKAAEAPSDPGRGADKEDAAEAPPVLAWDALIVTV